MLLNAKNGSVSLKNGKMDYIRFGTGEAVLVMLPGLGDALRSMKGMALPMALLYRRFAGDFTVYAFSRKSPLAQGAATRDMAQDLAEAMDALGIERAHIFGVSMGGMIAQWLAVDHPEKVRKLVLTVTSSRPNPTLRESVEEWIALAKAGDAAGFMDSNLHLIYSEAYYRRNRWMGPLVGKLTKPRSYDRFYIQAEACLTHDAYPELWRIRSDTLVLGGAQDRVLGPDASRELAQRIPGATLEMYPQWGHGLYEEEKQFPQRILDFLREAQV